MIELKQLRLLCEALLWFFIAALSSAKIYDRDVHLDRNWKGLWEEFSYRLWVVKPLQEELSVYNGAL